MLHVNFAKSIKVIRNYTIEYGCRVNLYPAVNTNFIHLVKPCSTK